MWKTEYGFVEGKKRFQLCFVRNSPVEEPEKQLGLRLIGHLLDRQKKTRFVIIITSSMQLPS